MGIGAIVGTLLGAGGSGRNVVTQTIGAFRPNAEAQAQREAEHRSAALTQYAAEFYARENRSWLDILADGLNRLVRPVVTITLLIPIPATVYNPEGMAAVWLAMASLPAGYWAVVGVVVPFYFGGRMQMKALNSGKWRAAATAAAALARTTPSPEATDAQGDGPNAALDDWAKSRGRSRRR